MPPMQSTPDKTNLYRFRAMRGAFLSLVRNAPEPYRDELLWAAEYISALEIYIQRTAHEAEIIHGRRNLYALINEANRLVEATHGD